MIGNKLKPGDHLSFTQKDGKELEVIVYDIGIVIKASKLGTNLDIDRGSSYSAIVMATGKEE